MPILYSLVSTLTKAEHQKLQSFIQRILSEKILNEIQKLLLDQHFYCRFLKAHNFEIDKAIIQLKLYLQWRKDLKIDTILEHEFS